MSALDQIIEVNIFRETSSLAKASFGLPLILDEFLVTKTDPAFERYREYGSIGEMADDGWEVTDDIYKMAQIIFSQNPKVPKIAIGRQDAGDTNEADALNKIAAVNNNWYGLLSPTIVKAEILTIAGWSEANGKLYSALSNENGILDVATVDDVMSELNALGYIRTLLNYHPTAGQRLDCGIIGRMFPDTPGRATWCYKNIAGVAAYDLSAGNKGGALDKKSNVYTSIGGMGRYEQGTVAVGEYIDIIWGLDYLKSEIQSEVFSTLANVSDKIPFTDDGVTAIVGIIRGVLNRFAGDSFKLLQGDSIQISAPLTVDISMGDKAARTLPNVEWEALLQGAIHFVKVRGVVSL